MPDSSRRSSVEAFFLPATPGERFCVHYAVRDVGPRSLGVVFVPAFAEEMNKARHVVAQASRLLQSLGIGVLVIDPLGCGDSTGGFEDASWAAWTEDLRTASAWMRGHGYGRVGLWGMRLGALLACEAAQADGLPVDRCLLWQPVMSGDAQLTQFLRLRSANALLAGGVEGESGKDLRSRLQAGETLEVAGYPLTGALARDLQALKLDPLRPRCPVDWVEIVPEAGRPPSAAANRVASQWQDDGIRVTVHAVPGESFWSSANGQELVQCPELVEATAALARDWL